MALVQSMPQRNHTAARVALWAIPATVVKGKLVEGCATR